MEDPTFAASLYEALRSFVETACTTSGIVCEVQSISFSRGSIIASITVEVPGLQQPGAAVTSVSQQLALGPAELSVNGNLIELSSTFPVINILVLQYSGTLSEITPTVSDFSALQAAMFEQARASLASGGFVDDAIVEAKLTGAADKKLLDFTLSFISTDAVSYAQSTHAREYLVLQGMTGTLDLAFGGYQIPVVGSINNGGDSTAAPASTTKAGQSDAEESIDWGLTGGLIGAGVISFVLVALIMKGKSTERKLSTAPYDFGGVGWATGRGGNMGGASINGEEYVLYMPSLPDRRSCASAVFSIQRSATDFFA